jgi:pimeloyl-ACP methyl ester carboxylesterase
MPRSAPSRILCRQRVVLAAVGALALTAAGCSYGISVRRAAGPDLLDAWRASVIEADELSPRTRQTLRRWDLEPVYQRRPAEALARLQALVTNDPEPEVLFALAEISYLLGRHAEKAGSQEACAHYYLCAGYAYHYLFDDESREAINSFDPRFRLACDLYNTALAKCIRSAQRAGRLDSRQQFVLPTLEGQGCTISVVHHDFPWKPEEFGPLLFSGDYEVVGLANQYRGYGLGVALIGTRLHTPDGDRAPGHAFYPDQVSFPVTAFFRFDGSIAELSARRAGRLELYNPLAVQTIRVKKWTIPLEADLTTPLAYFLSHTDLDGIEYTGFLHADKLESKAGIYMFEPYKPGKIPVVMVHGLLASPLTWTTMFNDLRADPTLREHYQFWFYLYPTADPFVVTAADLRRSLVRLRTELDPQHIDPALDQMVLVGHSMGGLVARLLTADSGADYWHLVSREPFERVKFDPKTREELREVFFFAPEPGVRRVVFIATPHRGSGLSPSLPGQLAAQFIGMPKKLIKVAHDAAREDPHMLPFLHKGGIPTSVDMLAPGSPALELLAREPRPAGVHFHSIIGEVYGTGKEATDGVVPYTSAHLDGVDSEVIVPASHVSIQHHPRAVLEVWRILREHLVEVSGRQDLPAVPAAVDTPTAATNRPPGAVLVRR